MNNQTKTAMIAFAKWGGRRRLPPHLLRGRKQLGEKKKHPEIRMVEGDWGEKRGGPTTSP